MAKGFTDKYIISLKPTEKEYWIREGQGFAIRVYPSGEKGWYYIYTFEGRKRFMKLGTYPDMKLVTARDRHGDAKKKVAHGVDPLTEQEQAKDERRKAPTISDLIDEYIKKHAMPNKRSWQEDERILNKDALAAWGKRKAADIKKRDVVLLLEKIIERGSPGSANSNFKIIRKMFRFAVQRDILEHSPCDGVVMPAPLNRGDRVLTEAEMKALWVNMDSCSISYEIKRALKLILVTAQRPGEVIGMHTNEINDRWWTIPAERSKNKQAHRVFLTDTAIGLIGPLKKVDTKTGKETDMGIIFPCPKKPKESEPAEKQQAMKRLSISQAVMRALAVPVKVNGKPVFDEKGEPLTENKLGVDHFTPHDLRRTASTFMSQIGFMDEIIDAVLNHTKQGIIRTYNLNRYDKEKQQVLEAWERKLNSIVEGKEGGKVISIGSKKAA